VVYSAVFGSYDAWEPSVPGDYDFVLFTDDPGKKVPGGKSVLVDLKLFPPVRRARLVKCLPSLFLDLQEQDRVLWIDGSITITRPDEMLAFVNANPQEFVVPRHRFRFCAYAEAKECEQLRLDRGEILRAQVERYRKVGYPQEWGLSETGLLLRRNTLSVRRHGVIWWSEILTGSHRDQVSCDYALWRSLGKGSFTRTPMNVDNCGWISRKHHLGDRMFGGS
jgi:hypothetical protein